MEVKVAEAPEGGEIVAAQANRHRHTNLLATASNQTSLIFHTLLNCRTC